MHISSDHPEFTKLKRYAISYGAVLVPDEEEADYIVLVDRQTDSDKTVSTDWVFDCIKASKLVTKF